MKILLLVSTFGLLTFNTAFSQEAEPEIKKMMGTWKAPGKVSLKRYRM